MTIGFRSLLGLALVAVVAAPVRAQEATSAPVPTSPSEPAAIQAAEIPQRADETFARLREIARELAVRDDVVPIQQSLAGVKAEVQSLQRDPRMQAGVVLTFRDVEDLQRRWWWVREQLTTWSATLTQRTMALDVRLQDLRRIEETWAATEASANVQDIPRALRDSIRAVRAEVAQLINDARAWRGTVLTLQGELAELNTIAAERQVALDAEAERARSHLLISESQPLWAVARIVDWQSIARTIATVRARSRSDALQFLRSESERLLLHLGIFVVLVLAALRVRRRSRSWDLDDNALEVIAPLRDRPLSAALLVTVFCGVWIYSLIPPSIMRFAFALISVIPLVRVLRVGMFTDLPSAPVELGVLALLVAIASLFPPADPITRFVLLAMNVAIGVWLAWLSRPQRLARIRTTDSWRRVLQFGARLGQLIASLAIIANVIGNVALAVLLSYGLVVSIFTSVALDATRQIASGFFIAGMKSRIGRSLNLVQRYEATLRERVHALLTLGAVVTWAYLTMNTLSASGPFLRSVRSVLQAALPIGSLRVSLGDVLALGITMWLALVLSRIIATVLDEDVLPRLSLPRGVPGAVSVTAKYAVLLLGFMAALSAAGVEFGQLTVLLGAFGIGLSFGLQNIVNNFVSGLILIFERPIQVGDVVEIEQVTGEVRSIGIRSSLIRTFDGAEVIVPNGNLLSQRVTNWTLTDRQRRVEINVGVAYATDPQRVIELLLGVARAHPDVLEHPPPTALFVGFGASSLDFSLRVWTLRQEPFPQLKSDLGVSIYRVLSDAGIEIPFPQTDLHVYADTASQMLGGAAVNVEPRRQSGSRSS